MSAPTQTSVGLYQVEHMQHLEVGASGIVPITDIVLAVDLVLVFSMALPGVNQCSETCMEGYLSHYLNTFTDKETFHILHQS